MSDIEIRKQALEREGFRLQQLDECVLGLPTNKGGRYKSAEANSLLSLATAAHKTLCRYDMLPDPPALAGITETWFDTCIERIADIARASRKQIVDG